MYLLGNAQTLLGVLITLIVLCLFNNGSNFIRSLLENIQEELTEYIRLYITKKTLVSPTLTSVSNETEDADFRKYDLYLKVLELFESENTHKVYDKKKELELIELHLLLMSLLVIAADLFFLKTPETELFLLFLTVLSFIYTTYLWWRFCNTQAVAHRILDYGYHLAMKHSVVIMVCSVLAAFLLSIMLHGTALYDWVMNSHTAIGCIFTSYVMLYSVIVPLALAYFIPRKYAKEYMEKVDESIKALAEETQTACGEEVITNEKQ